MRRYSDYQKQDQHSAIQVNTYSPLMLAAYHGDTDLVLAYLERGDDPNEPDFNGNTILMGAAFKGHNEVIRLLLEYGADPNRQNPKGQTALMFAQMFGRDQAAAMLAPQIPTGFREKIGAWFSYLKTNLIRNKGGIHNV